MKRHPLDSSMYLSQKIMGVILSISVYITVINSGQSPPNQLFLIGLLLSVLSYILCVKYYELKNAKENKEKYQIQSD